MHKSSCITLTYIVCQNWLYFPYETSIVFFFYMWTLQKYKGSLSNNSEKINAYVKILQWLLLTGYLTLKELWFTIEEGKKELEMLQRDSTKIEMWGGRCGVSTTSLYVVSVSVLGCVHTKYNAVAKFFMTPPAFLLWPCPCHTTAPDHVSAIWHKRITASYRTRLLF